MSDNPSGSGLGTAYFDAGALDTPRIWSVLFTVRHVAIVTFAACIAAFPQFGADRHVLAAFVIGVLPYDVALHVYARRHHRLPRSMPYTYAVVPPALAVFFPDAWFVAVAACLGNLSIFAVTFPFRTTAASAAIAGGALAAAGSVGSAPGLAPGLVGYLVVAPSITVSVGALFDAREASERRYGEFVENANDMIYTHDLTDLRFLSANQAALRLTGYTAEELGRISVADIVPEDNLDRAADMIASKLAGDAAATTYELEILTRDGRRIPVEVSTRLIYQRGEAVAVQGIARDISERRQVEAQRAALDRHKTEFIANAAHELRTPLTTLSGLASVLANNRGLMTEAEVGDALEALERQGQRARLLADKLLDLSAVEVGGLDVTPERVVIADVVERILEEAPPPSGVSVDVRVDATLAVLADPLRLGEIISNLVTNAYRYGGPKVVVDAAPRDGAVDLWVDDDGPGVPDELADSAFEPFTRGDHGGRPDSTGLGLAICARLAEALDGTIVYEPGEPVGARFRLTLPAAA